MVEPEPSKLLTRVRFPSPAPDANKRTSRRGPFFVASCRTRRLWGFSLAGTAGQTRPSATTGNQTLPSATTGNQTRPSATGRPRFRPPAVAARRFCHGCCRRGVSLSRQMSLGRQSARRGGPDSTVGDNWKPDSTVGDRKDPVSAPSCRRASSLSRMLSPGRQSVPPDVAGASVCPARRARIDRRRHSPMSS